MKQQTEYSFVFLSFLEDHVIYTYHVLNASKFSLHNLILV
jgi:hypothetical protein